MIKIDVAGALNLKGRLELLKLPSAKRTRLLKRMAIQVRKQSRQRLRQQVDLAGKRFTPRKDSRNRKKLLRGLAKTMRVSGNSSAAKVYFASALTAKIAYAHQHGIDELMTKEKLQKQHGTPNYDDQATRRQAKELRTEGFKVRRNGKGYRRPPLKWITQNMTIGQAGLVLRVLRDTPRVSRWTIPLPERAFLGVNEKEVNDFISTVFEKTVYANN